MKIEVGYWNINGLSEDKCREPDFIKAIYKYDIICLTETWEEEKNKQKLETIEIPKGYMSLRQIRKNKHKRAKRNSGGILVIYKETLHKYITEHNKKNENIFWLRIDNKILGLEKNVFLGITYISPIYSSIYNTNPHMENTFECLKKQLASFNKDDLIILGGDFNARTGNLNDFIIDDNTNYVPLPEFYKRDTFVRERVNQDKTINKFGEELRELCISTNLKILNGRTLGDLTGQFTYIGKNGCSTVDYILVSEDIMTGDDDIITYFKVANLNHLSDHRLISVKLGKNIIAANNNNNIKETIKLSTLQKYNKPCREHFTKTLDSPMIKQKIKQSINKISTETGIDSIDKTVDVIENIMNEAAGNLKQYKPSINDSQKPSGPRRRNKYKKPWYNNDCRLLKRNMNYTCKALSINPQNPDIRGKFYTLKKKYRKLTKYLKRKYERGIIQELESCHQTDNNFWKTLKKLTNTKPNTTLPDPIELQKYFTELYNENNLGEPTFDAKEEEIINTNETINIDHEITINEIEVHINKLKNKKAPGLDGIFNEMLKYSNKELLKLYKELFNKIFQSGEFPQKWNTSLTRLIHKGGSTLNPSNFRGISLTSNLCKLFTSILQTRISTILEKNKIIAREQGGFRKGFRTSDHLFVLNTIIKKYINKGEKIFSCIVDLKKAFDSVWREGLKYKLKKVGFGEKLVNLISAMYEDTSTSLLHGQNMLPEIKTNKGVKQGDNLSPTLFNIYVNDFPKKLAEGQTSPVKIAGKDTNCLMWADDIIILSKTKEGLQQCLNNMYKYCQEWKLEINRKKTKVIVFNKTGAKIKSQFYLHTYLLENVTQHPYLGFTLAASGTLTHGTQILIDKAKKSWFTILRLLGKSKQKNINTYITLFDYIIKPIAMYACEIWGENIKTVNNIADFGNSPCERFHTRVCKNILGAHRKTSNIATLLEIGRFPISSEIQMRMVKYLFRLETLDTSGLLYSAYLEQKHNMNNNIRNWLNTTKDILDRNGLSYLHMKHRTKEDIITIKKDTQIAKQRIEDTFTQEALYYVKNKSIAKEGKLIFFGEIKNSIKMENYLKIQNIEYRNALRDIRMSTHKLNIEVGRYENKARIQRLCETCILGHIESEDHFILECPTYEDIRSQFFTEMYNDLHINLKKMGTTGIKYIFEEGSLTTFKKFGKFLVTCWKIRNHTLGKNIHVPNTSGKKHPIPNPSLPVSL